MLPIPSDQQAIFEITVTDLIGEGQTTQVVLTRQRLDNNFQQLQARWQQFQQLNMSHSEDPRRVR